MKNRQRQKDILFSILIFCSAFAVNLLIDYGTRQVFVGKEETDLTQTEYNIINELGVGYRMLAEDE